MLRPGRKNPSSLSFNMLFSSFFCNTCGNMFVPVREVRCHGNRWQMVFYRGLVWRWGGAFTPMTPHTLPSLTPFSMEGYMWPGPGHRQTIWVLNKNFGKTISLVAVNKDNKFKTTTQIFKVLLTRVKKSVHAGTEHNWPKPPFCHRMLSSAEMTVSQWMLSCLMYSQ